MLVWWTAYCAPFEKQYRSVLYLLLNSSSGCTPMELTCSAVSLYWISAKPQHPVL